MWPLNIRIVSVPLHGLNMKALAYDSSMQQFDNQVTLVKTIDEVFEKTDYITLHLPYTPSLHHLVDEKLLKK